MKTKAWSDQSLESAVSNATSFAEVVRALGLTLAGGNYEVVRRHILRLGLSTSHFSNSAKLEALRSNGKFPLTFEEIFCEGSRVRTIPRYVKKFNLLEYRCEGCGNLGEHNGQPLVLQVDHINGVDDDNRPENLRYLCPNCHSQTESFSGRNKEKVYKEPKVRQVIRRVPYETLASRYVELDSYLAVAREFGVSDVTVRKAVKITRESSNG